MNKLFKELISLHDEDFEYEIYKKTQIYSKENNKYIKPHLIPVSLDFGIRGSEEKLEDPNVKKILLPTNSFFIKTFEKTISDFGLDEYLKTELDVLLNEKELFSDTIKKISEITKTEVVENIKDEYYIESQKKELESIISSPIIFKEEIIELKFDSNIVDVEDFNKKLKQFSSYKAVTQRIYLLKEQESTFDEVYVLQFLKDSFEQNKLTNDELNMILEKYTKINNGLNKYSLRILYY